MMRKLLVYLAIVIVAIIGFLGLITKLPITRTYIWIIGFAMLVLVFLFLLALHKIYERSIDKVKKRNALLAAYLILTLNIIIGTRYYSVEWAALAFLLCSVVFYDLRIDSRFMILPALLLLGYVPFLLIGEFEKIAELAAIYVYYFLVAGVALQVIEHAKNTVPMLEFEKTLSYVLLKLKWSNFVIAFGIASIAVIVMNRFFNLELVKWSMVYAYLVILVFYLLSAYKKKYGLRKIDSS